MTRGERPGYLRRIVGYGDKVVEAMYEDTKARVVVG